MGASQAGGVSGGQGDDPAVAGGLICPICSTRYPLDSKFCTHDGSPLRAAGPASGDPLIGTVLADRYRIVKLLGEGGMGRVYEASHLNIAKRYALKLLRPSVLENPEAIVRFRQEAWAASSIGHPNIINIDDFATLPDGGVYLAMEFLDGESLAARMQQRHLSLGEILHTMAQVGSALAAAHDKGIVHRDIKPENIFLAKRPQGDGEVVKLLDFGIAKISDTDRPHLTKTGAVFGTPFYMSPEQALGRPLDHRTDIYSTGVILYELAVGHVPFQAESFLEVLHHHISTEPPAPSEVAPGQVDPGLEAIIRRAMHKDREQRYATMAALLEDLQQLGHRVLGIDPQALGQSFRPATGPMRPPGAPAPQPQAASQSQPSLPKPGRVSVAPRASSPSVPPPPSGSAPLPAPIASGPMSVPPGALGTAQAGPASTGPAPQPGPKKEGASLGLLVGVGLAAVVLGLVGVMVWKRNAEAPGSTEAAAPPTAPTAAAVTAAPAAPETPKPGRPAAIEAPKPDRPATAEPGRPSSKPAKAARADAKAAKGKPEPTRAGPPPPVAAAPPPPRSEWVDPNSGPGAHRPPPAAPSIGQPLGSSLVDQEAGKRNPGIRRVGTVMKGQVAEEDGRNDYTINLEAGRCYTFYTVGGTGVKEISLYLWNPLGKRVATHRAGEPQATFLHCTVMSGPFHVQVKVTDGAGETQLGVYTR